LILSDYPLRASRDFDGAIRATVADLLARVTYIVPGGSPCPGHVHRGPSEPPSGHTLIHEEWADGDHRASWPGIVLMDARGSFGSGGGFAPGVDEDTHWPDDDDAPLDQIGLRCLAMYEMDMPILIEANTAPMRRQVLVQAFHALTGGLDYGPESPDRYGVVLDAGGYYYDRKVTVIPLSSSRLDVQTSGGRVRSADIIVRCSIPVVYPVMLPTIQTTTFADGTDEPEATSAMIALDVY